MSESLFPQNDVITSALTCSFSSLYDPWRGVSLQSGTSVSQQQNQGAEGQNSTHFNKHTPSILLSICVFLNHETETTKSARVSDESLKACWREIFGWFETDVTSVTDGQRLQSFSLRSVSEQETGRRGRRTIALGRYQRSADASHATTTSPPTPLSRSQPLLLSSFLSSLSHCKV